PKKGSQLGGLPPKTSSKQAHTDAWCAFPEQVRHAYSNANKRAPTSRMCVSASRAHAALCKSSTENCRCRRGSVCRTNIALMLLLFTHPIVDLSPYQPQAEFSQFLYPSSLPKLLPRFALLHDVKC